jgi:hypothetical protein
VERLDVVTGGEVEPVPGDDEALRRQGRHGGGEHVEDLLVERWIAIRVTLGRGSSSTSFPEASSRWAALMTQERNGTTSRAGR